MRLLFWRRPQIAVEAPAAPQRWTWLRGRRILTTTPYVLPKDKAEGDRLDLQHHLLKIAAGGLYRAPIRQPRSIPGCGLRHRHLGPRYGPTIPTSAGYWFRY